jgi:RND family efflux transporter MFP subunit
MKGLNYFSLLVLLISACGKKQETIKPELTSITESVYANGYLKSENQYQVFPSVNGVISKIYVEEGDTVTTGEPLMLLAHDTQRYSKENAQLAERLNDVKENEGKKLDAQLTVELAKNKLLFDSSLFFRQRALWEQKIGTKVELEQKEVAYAASKSNYFSALIRQRDLLKQLEFNSNQSKNNLKISDQLESDFTIKSEVNGRVYALYKSVGEWVGVQTPLAILGDAKQFRLQMRIDEYDILKIKIGQDVLVTMDSYKGKVFMASVSKINPLMNEKTKSFTIEAKFSDPPEKLYPNLTFEANIIIQKKDNVLIVPNRYFVNDSTLLLSNGESVKVITGLKDYRCTEILKGVAITDELLMPEE